MGGYRSGRWHDHQKAVVVEHCVSVDTALLRRDRLLQNGSVTGIMTWADSSGGVLKSATFSVEQCTTSEAILRLVFIAGAYAGAGVLRSQVRLASTRPHYGGRRWWFVCPRCEGLARRLFMPLDKAWLGCRRCHQLTYRSCQESHTIQGFVHRLRASSTGSDVSVCSPLSETADLNHGVTAVEAGG